MKHEIWSIEALVPGGDGLTRLADGRIGFATGTVPGDAIRVRDLELHKTWVRAKDWELVTAGPERVAPACEVAERCGGCDWMHLSRPAQLEAKVSILRDALTRVGRFRELPHELEVVSAGPALRYRIRLRFHVDDAGRIGLFEKRSHRIVEMKSCLVAHPEVDATLGALRELAAKSPGALAHFSEIEVRVAQSAPRVSLSLKRRDPARAPTADVSQLEHELRQRFSLGVLGQDSPPDADQLYDLPAGVTLRAPPGGFVQVNWEVNAKLVSAVVEGARARGAETFLDLYCGAGNFTLPLLAAGLRGVGVERAGSAIRAARRAAREAKLSDDSFIAADVEHELDRRASRREHFDLVVLDPPRAGAREVVGQLPKLGAPHIALCSCDPVTLARDLKTLCERDYLLESVTGFDMFPQTHHLETLVWLRIRA